MYRSFTSVKWSCGAGCVGQILPCLASLMMVTEAPVSTSMMRPWSSTFTVVFKSLVAVAWRGYKMYSCPLHSGALAVSELVHLPWPWEPWSGFYMSACYDPSLHMHGTLHHESGTERGHDSLHTCSNVLCLVQSGSHWWMSQPMDFSPLCVPTCWRSLASHSASSMACVIFSAVPKVRSPSARKCC